MVLVLMVGWIGMINDVKGAFLKGSLAGEKEQMYMKVPKGFEMFYPNDVVLMLLRAIYGTKQAAMEFLKELLEYMKDMEYQRNGADLCLYFNWTAAGLIIWMSWIDDCVVWGPMQEVPKESE
eukprot:577086-Ditylum_brightwellii.AAC.1